MEKRIITVSREFGSGGRSVGKALAKRLGWKYYDKELVKQVALESGFDPAPRAYRADRIVRLYGESERSPEQRLQDKDKKRRVNYKHYTGRDWGVSQNYHLSLDSADIGVDHCADVILYAMGLDPAKLPMPKGEKEHN